MNIKDYSVYIIQLCLTQTYDTHLLLISNTVVWHYVLDKVLLVVRSRLNLLHFYTDCLKGCVMIG